MSEITKKIKGFLNEAINKDKYNELFDNLVKSKITIIWKENVKDKKKAKEQNIKDMQVALKNKSKTVTLWKI